MAARNRDFLDRYAELERRVRALESVPTAYMESVIVGGEFLAATEVPPFFTPFGGAIIRILSRFISGDGVDLRVRRNTVDISGLVSLTAATTDELDLDPPVYLDEGDLIEVDIVGTSGICTGLSVGVIISP